MKKVILVMFSLMISMGAYGGKDYRYGNTLLESCTTFEKLHERNIDSGFKGGYCVGLVKGIMATIIHLTSKDSPVVCIPDGVTVEQGVRVVLKYLRDNPSILHEFAEPLVMNTFFKAYPCT